MKYILICSELFMFKKPGIMELLIRRAQNGDNEAFIEAINEYMPQMYKVAKCRIKNEEDIGDAIQETIFAAFCNLKKLKNIAYFKTCITKILINKCNDIFEKSKGLYVESFDKLKDIHSTCGDNDNIDQKLDFDNVLSNLKDEYKLVIVMFYVNGFNIREI